MKRKKAEEEVEKYSLQITHRQAAAINNSRVGIVNVREFFQGVNHSYPDSL